MRSRRFLANVVLGAVVSLHPGCTCSKKTENLGECGAPLPSRLVRTDTQKLGVGGAGGHGVILLWPELEQHAEVSLRIDTAPPTTLPFGGRCEGRFELAPDAEGKRLAVGCPGQGSWEIVHVLGPGRAFPGITVTGATVAWSAVADFDRAAPELFTGYLATNKTHAEHLVAEVRARRGEAGVASLLEATLNAPRGSDALGSCGAPPGIWADQYRGLSSEVRAGVDARLRAAAEDPSSSEAAFRRAMLLLDVDGGRYDAVILGRLERDVPRLDAAVVELGLRVLTGRRAADAARVACRAVTERAKPEVALRRVAHAAIARTRYACPGLAAKVRTEFCAAEWECMKDGCRAADRDELTAVTDATRDAAVAAVGCGVSRLSVAREGALAFGAALRSQGPLPADLRARAERLSYPEAEAPSGVYVDECRESTAEGARCRIDAVARVGVLCDAAQAPSRDVGIHRVRFDDKAHVHTVTRAPGEPDAGMR